jgi:hypothetical protein
MGSVGMDPQRLRANRCEELRRALDILGAGPPQLLGYVDSGIAGDVGNDDEGSFWRAPSMRPWDRWSRRSASCARTSS